MTERTSSSAAGERRTSVPPARRPSRAPGSGQGAMDPVLYAVVVGLVGFGVVMVYSASFVFAEQRYGDGSHFLVRQAVYAVLGLALMGLVARLDRRWLQRLGRPALAFSALLLLAVLAGLGHKAGGATRWIAVGPIHVQPSEVAKLALVLWLADSLARKSERLRDFSVGFLPHIMVAGLLGLLCLGQPDFGSAVVIGLLTFTMLFAAGVRTGYLLGAVLAAAPLAWWLVVSSPYRLRRIQAFLAPFEHRSDAGYQLVESLLGFAHGGLSGVGLGDSRQKLLYLPEAHTDFIAAIVGEELGFVGVGLLVGAYLVIAWRGLRAALRAGDSHGTWLAVGATTLLVLQALVNLGVVLAMLPSKGLVLPFLSYGGSALLVDCVAAGLLLNVSRGLELRDASAPRPLSWLRWPGRAGRGGRPSRPLRTVAAQRRRAS